MGSNIKKVYISPGHSKGLGENDKYTKERDLMIQVAKYMESYLKDHYIVSIKKNPDTLENTNTIIHEANDWGANLFISINYNIDSIDNVEILVCNKNSKSLADVFWKYIKDFNQISHDSDPINYHSDLSIFRLTNMKTILIECNHINDLNNSEKLKDYGIALAKATAEFMNLPIKTRVPVYETLYNLNFKESKKAISKILSVIPKGTIIRGSLDSEGWLRISYNNKTGYVKQNNNEKVYCKRLY